MILELNVKVRYSTGANDVETENAYGSLDPEECAEVDRQNVRNTGLVDFLSFLEDVPEITWSIGPVR